MSRHGHVHVCSIIGSGWDQCRHGHFHVCSIIGSGWGQCRHGHVHVCSIIGSGWGQCRHGALDDRRWVGLFVCMYCRHSTQIVGKPSFWGHCIELDPCLMV